MNILSKKILLNTPIFILLDLIAISIGKLLGFSEGYLYLDISIIAYFILMNYLVISISIKSRHLLTIKENEIIIRKFGKENVIRINDLEDCFLTKSDKVKELCLVVNRYNSKKGKEEVYINNEEVFVKLEKIEKEINNLIKQKMV